MASLSARLLIAASVVLVAFLGLTGLALDRAFRESALVAVQDRLQAQIYMLLGAADLDDSKRLVLPAALPEARFSTPGSGLYAWVTASGNRLVWRSPSMLGIAPAVLPVTPAPGSADFQQIADRTGTEFFVLSFTVSWEIDTDKYRPFTFRVAETRRGFDAQVLGFRHSLWGWFLAAALVLLLVQSLILRWGLKPLRQVAQEVTDIEAGRRTALVGPYPKELRPLTRNLDAFIHDSHARLERYRNALGDLAHSLKTPLAVLRGAAESEPSPTHLRQTIREQVGRMNQTVEYQLQRAAASGRIAMAAPVPVAPLVQKIVQSLAKVYAGKHLAFRIETGEGLRFHGDEGDFMEIIGNLADNACKWSHSQVAIRASQGPGSAAKLLLDVEDDGPGIPRRLRSAILERGMRADPNTAGHGIGLAIVRNLVEEVYRGSLEIDTAALGGARIRVHL